MIGENFKRVNRRPYDLRLQRLTKAQCDIYDRFEEAIRNGDTSEESRLHQSLEDISWKIDEVKYLLYRGKSETP